MKKILFILLCLLLSGQTDLSARAKKNKNNGKANKEKVSSSKTDTPYSKIFKDKKYTTEKGLVTIHNVEGKIYIELPFELLKKRMLMGAMVESVSDPLESSVGTQPAPPEQVFFDKTDSLILICRSDDTYRGNGDKGIDDALAKSHIPAIEASFPIIAPSPDSTALLFEATSFFVKDDPKLNPLDPNAYNAIEGYVKRTGTFSSSNSMISGMAAFDDNFSVTGCLSYQVKSALLGIFAADEEAYLTAHVKRTFMLLPDEPMRPRIADSRIGTGAAPYVKYSDGQKGAELKYHSTRWRLEPTDPDAVSEGRLSPVKKPILFYIDNNFPEKWIPYIEQSVARWNKTFEEIGLENAIQTKMFPEDDPEFDPANIKFSCIRYVVSPARMILDNKWSDPRTGEIISANIYVRYGVQEAIQSDRFLQTSAADPSARHIELPEDEIGEALSSILLRNIGHCLGLTDNMAASFAFAADSLKSPSFTSRYGISSSVMDRLPYNFVASASDFEKGVKMMQSGPGLYDYYAIKWLYGSIPDAEEPEDEIPVLMKWIEEKREDPVYYYGKKQNSRAFYDPRAMSLDLGDNPVNSTRYGMQGLAAAIANADAWLDREDYDYEYRQALYDYIVNQIYEYVKQVFVNVGGIYINEKYEGDPNPAYVSVPREIQRGHLLWIMEQISDLSWLEENNLSHNTGLLGSAAEFCQKFFSKFIFVQIEAMWLSEMKAEDPYTQIDAARDVSDFIWRGAAAGQEPSDVMKFQQNMMVEYLIFWSNVMGSRPVSTEMSAIDKKMEGILNRQIARRNAVSDISGMMPLKEIRYESSPEREHQWYGLLLETKKLIETAVSAAKSDNTRNHYRYLVFKIDKALKTD